MLTLSEGLDARTLAAIAALEQEVVAHDGGRLKLERSVLDTREPDRVQDVLWWEGERLLGFGGLFAFGQPVELAGMVAPDARRRGIGSALLDALRPLAAAHGGTSALLVVPSATPSGREFAVARGGTHDHSEHFLVLGETPPGEVLDPRVTVRPAVPEDLGVVLDLLRSAFDWEPSEDSFDRVGDSTRVIDLDGVPIGTLRVSRHGDWAGVYGFAVHPDHQGRGIGRDVLGRTCRELRDAGVPRLTLEVETRNENALRLYTSLGFEKVAGEDYWAVAL